MVRYICPVCEQELKGRRFCPVCRKFVRDPIVYEGVLPNEDTGDYLTGHEDLHPGRHCVEPNRERCETPLEKRAEARFTSAADSGGHFSDGGTVYQKYSGRPAGVPQTRRRPARRRGIGCVTVFIIVWVLISLLSTAVEEGWFDTFASWFLEADGEPESVDAEAEDQWEELVLDEIMAEGAACTGQQHYSVDGKEFYGNMAAWLEDRLGVSAEIDGALAGKDPKDGVLFSVGDSEIWVYGTYDGGFNVNIEPDR